MIAKLLNIPPVVIDGLLWSLVSLFMFQQAFLSTEEAYKYSDPKLLFWLKFTVGSLAAMVGSLKAFRSTSYAHHLQVKSDASKDTDAVPVNS